MYVPPVYHTAGIVFEMRQEKIRWKNQQMNKNLH